MSTIELSGSQYLYAKPEALHSQDHAGLNFVDDGQLLAKVGAVNAVPLLVGEFVQAMHYFPIVFGGPEKTPMAILGMKEGQNLFLKDGKFEAGVYVPAYLRRYPFTLAGTGTDDYVVCIDRKASGFVEGGEGQPLFENGEPTDFTKNAINFLNEFEAERKRSAQFVEELIKADLHEVKHTLALTAGGEQREVIADYYGVSEERLRALPDAQLAEMVRQGAVTAIDAHLLSLKQWDALIARRDNANGEKFSQVKQSFGRKK
ncbi:SapC family protein [Sphingomonas floccifaciens]|uniref:SapC family protein n=1 Tax=Sphingomonas floccifaciens TaxID=1844115 RepID=A0ABW4NER6_9SPHN